MGSIKNTPTLPSGGTPGTTLVTTANSAGGGDAFDGASSNVKYDTASDGRTVYRVSGQGTTGSQQVVRWNNRQLDTQCVDVGIVRFNGVAASDEPFFRAAWGTTVGAEGGASLMLSLSTTGKLKVFINGSGSASFLGTATLPTDNRELRVVIFRTSGTAGSSNGTLRVRVFDGRTSTTALEDTDSQTPLTGLPLVGSTAGAAFENVRWLKYGSEVLAGSVDLGYAALYWGTTDAVSTSAYPITPAAGVSVSASAVTPATADTGVQRSVTLSITNGNGNAVTWGPVDWGDGSTPDAAVTTAAGVTSRTFTHTPAAGVAAGTKSGSFSWSQA